MSNNERNTKQQFYNKMGWCECNSCKQRFLEWEQYLEHVCAQGVNMRDRKFPWDLSGD